MKSLHLTAVLLVAVFGFNVPAKAAQAKSDPDSSPKIETRPLEKYVAVRRQTSLDQLSKVIPAGIGQVAGWLGARRIRPAGSPFVRYRVVDMGKHLEIEIGFPVFGPIKATPPLVNGALPAGRYVTYTYHGAPDGLIGANGVVLAWARKNGLALDQKPLKQGTAWGARVEVSLTDPAHEPDPKKFKTRILIRLAK